MKRNGAAWGLILALALRAGAGEEDWEARSAALRTALHYDPSLPGQVEELCRLYAAERREAELAGIYETHVAQYPADKGAALVLLRIYQGCGSARAAEWARTVAARFPEDAYGLSLAYETLGEGDLLAGSVCGEALAGKRLERMTRLLVEMPAGSSPERLRAAWAAATTGLRPEDGDWRALAGAALGQGWAREVAAWLGSWDSQAMEAEAGLARERFLARAEEALGDASAAENRCRGVLARLDAGPAREAMLSFLQELLGRQGRGEAELETLRKGVVDRPQDVRLALDLAFWLRKMGRKAESAEVLRQASLRFPGAAELEGKILETLDGEALERYLQERLSQEGQGGRADLRIRLARLMWARGAVAEAWKEWEQAEGLLTGRERQQERLKLARELRAAGRAADAQRALAAAVREGPGSLEARWEWADLCRETGDGEGARQALAGAVVEGVAWEDALEQADRLLDGQFWDEAARWLDAAGARWGESGDLASRRLRLLTVRGGGGEEGRRLLESLRRAAASPEAYRSWLKDAWTFHGAFGEERRFLQEEKRRLLEGEWTAETVARFLGFCEFSQEEGQRDEVIAWLRGRLDDSPGQAGEADLRRMLARVLGSDEAHALEVEAQLKWLLERPGAAREEDRMRLASVYLRGQRPDLARTLLGAARVEEVTETEVLREAATLGRTLGDWAFARAVLRRWTRLAPGQAEAWEARWDLLRERGEEEEFRQALEECEPSRWERKERVTGAQLRAWWEESALRSLLEWRRQGRETEARELLARCRRRAGETGDGWVRWMEACWESGETGRRGAGGEEWIAFPGGWRLRAGEADRALRWAADPGGKEARGAAWTGKGGWRWSYELGDRNAVLEAVEAGDALLLLDERRALHAVDRVTGKLRWLREPEAERSGETEFLARANGSPLLLSSGSRLLKVGWDGRVEPEPESAPGKETGRGGPELAVAGACAVICQGGEVVGLGLEDGAVRWRLRLAGEEDRARRSPWEADRRGVLAGMCGENLAGFDPVVGVLAGIDSATGKLRWKVETGCAFREVVFAEEAVILRAPAEDRWQVREAAGGAVVWEGNGSGRAGGGLRGAGAWVGRGSGKSWELRPWRMPMMEWRLERESAGALLGGAGGAVVLWEERGLVVLDGFAGEERRLPGTGGEVWAAWLAGSGLMTAGTAGYAVWSLPGGLCLRQGTWPEGGPAWLRCSTALEWREGAVYRRVWTEWGPRDASLPFAGGSGPDGWWAIAGGGSVICWGGKE